MVATLNSSNGTKRMHSKQYHIIRGFLTKEEIEHCNRRFDLYLERGILYADDTSIYSCGTMFDDYCESKRHIVEEAFGKKFYSNYGYGRQYVKDEFLPLHVDRNGCEITMTIAINKSEPYDNWPIYYHTASRPSHESYDLMTLPDNLKNVNEVILEPGDALVYYGMTVPHWRHPLHYDWHRQVFLHYVEQDGKYKDWKWHKREALETDLDNKQKGFHNPHRSIS